MVTRRRTVLLLRQALEDAGRYEVLNPLGQALHDPFQQEVLDLLRLEYLDHGT